MSEAVDVVVIGAGPAGLSAALNLVRARREVVLIDGGRPRNAATLASHGFLSRDGISPLELRKLGREEVAGYPGATVVDRVNVTSVVRSGDGLLVRAQARGAAEPLEWRAAAVVVATGLTEVMPALPSLRAFYGTALHSCMACDGYEKADRPIALIGETDDLAEQALLLSAWSRDLVVFTNAIGEVGGADEARLGELGIRVERRAIADIEGDRAGMTGVRLADGEVVAREGGFLRPRYATALEFLDGLAPAADDDGLLVVDPEGRTAVPGLYATGDVTPPGPQQLIVAAGAGARTASAVHRDLLRVALGG
ncbi:NAD(P)/FAD-dependent oxidoreductase [Arenivirga flava]|uniref:Thioredoxin reductase n=1 Tax=Arenivirga flava TaxID=1930060 RepID=A0AA37XBZ5_9MICO|nr:NAD(P)/FAD-dependent oxidoreductase [Arenivirga flava]GMA27932.1 thioredoxin reductase [Arenivirga flava]